MCFGVPLDQDKVSMKIWLLENVVLVLGTNSLVILEEQILWQNDSVSGRCVNKGIQSTQGGAETGDSKY